MLYEITRSLPFPEWAPPDSRYWTLDVNDLWIEGMFYRHIQNPYSRETGPNGNFLSMWERRPSVQLNIPTLTADVVSRKLFASRHAPRIVHDDTNVMTAMKWLLKTSRLHSRMLDISWRGQSGSVGVCLKLIDGKPVVVDYEGKFCWPRYNEAQELQSILVAYPCSGTKCASLLNQRGLALVDSDGEGLNPDIYYWYLRSFGQDANKTYWPIKYEKWNPVTGPDENMKSIDVLTQANPLGFPMAHWITNLSSSTSTRMDGRATFARALPNLIDLDYGLSQLKRGVNACASPMLMTKGRMLNYDPSRGGVVLGPANTLQFKADERDQNGRAVSGADAKYVEMSGNGIDSGLLLCEKLKQWTQELITVTRKNPETIKGAMSGKAMELIDEELNDLVMVQQSNYGEDGELVIAQKLAKMCIQTSHPKFKGINEDVIDEIELQWPKLYTATAQETLYMVKALSQAVVDGLCDIQAARLKLDSEIGLTSDVIDADTNEQLKTFNVGFEGTPATMGGEEGVAKPTQPTQPTGAKPEAKDK